MHRLDVRRIAGQMTVPSENGSVLVVLVQFRAEGVIGSYYGYAAYAQYSSASQLVWCRVPNEVTPS
jgi:hypothetical protein